MTCNIKHHIKSDIPDHHFDFRIDYQDDDLILDFFIAHNDIHNIDRDIFAHYTSIDENTCCVTLTCGCKCPSVCKKNGRCAEHFYTQDFAAATKHTHFANTTQKLVIAQQNTDYSRVYACFGSIPPEILLNIVRFLRFPDLKVLYTMRIPGILALVQGDLMFNHQALYGSSVLTTTVVRKFQSEYTRGLRAIDRAILMTRVCPNRKETGLAVEKNRTSDMRNYNTDAISKKESTNVGYAEHIKGLKMKPPPGYSARVFHTIGFRRCLPGVIEHQAEFQYIREFVYDDYYARNPTETARIKTHYQDHARFNYGHGMASGPWA
jgi:hypothetical protein